MARISVEDARRLGIILPESGSTPVAPSRRTKRPASNAFLPAKPRSRGGRMDGRLVSPPFEFTLSIPLEPKTKRRHRSALPKAEILKAFRESKGNPQIFERRLSEISMRTYTDKETKAYEDALSRLAGAAMRGREPFRHPVEISFDFFLEGDSHLLPTDVRDPDLDNLIKAAWDAFNKVVWSDDRLVCRGAMTKNCAPQPRVDISVRVLQPLAVAP